jgi:hypothetical protein
MGRLFVSCSLKVKCCFDAAASGCKIRPGKSTTSGQNMDLLSKHVKSNANDSNEIKKKYGEKKRLLHQ